MSTRSLQRFYRRIVHLRSAFLTQYLVALVFFVLFWNEYLSYEWSAILWSVRLWKHDSDTIRFLVVADPQLIGYKNEPGSFAGIRRWDADRYLYKGFTRALHVTKPDAVIFLGDLFDEGVEMSNQEFEWTMKRFNRIFQMPDFLQRLYIPGDNDVGGEEVAVSSQLVERFGKQFISLFDVTKLGLGEFDVLHVNAFANSTNSISKGTGKLTMVVSHVPLLRAYGSLQRVVRSLNPSLVLSGHDHTAEFYQEGRTSYNFFRTTLFSHSKPVEARISKADPVVEFQTPTCSYRMGVPDMGYGVVLLRKDPSDPLTLYAKYLVLWLPGRFLQLTFYCIVVVLCALFFLKKLLWRKILQKRI